MLYEKLQVFVRNKWGIQMIMTRPSSGTDGYLEDFDAATKNISSLLQMSTRDCGNSL